MMPSPDDVLRQAMALPPSDRAALAGALIGSLDDESVDDDAERLWAAATATMSERYSPNCATSLRRSSWCTGPMVADDIRP